MTIHEQVIGWAKPCPKRPPTVITLAELRARFPIVGFAMSNPDDGPAATWSEPTLFDADDYGGRRCELCGRDIDGARADATHCSAACRARAWRQDRKLRGA